MVERPPQRLLISADQRSVYRFVGQRCAVSVVQYILYTSRNGRPPVGVNRRLRRLLSHSYSFRSSVNNLRLFSLTLTLKLTIW